MPISDVRHQLRAQRLIQRALASARLPHAYIFHGPDGVGKELFATRLAKLLLCERPVMNIPANPGEAVGKAGPVRDACGMCPSCHLVDVGNHPDLHLIYRQLNAHHPEKTVRDRKAIDLGVDVVRHFLIDAAGVTPACGRAKVFIVRDADRITPGAQNAMLKTLEEPPRTTFVILLARALDRLLPTTRSRCQLVEFAPLPTAFVAEMLARLVDDLPPAHAPFYAALAQGSLGAALEFASDRVAAANDEITALLAGLDRRSAGAAAKRLQDITKEHSARYRQRDRDLSDTAAQRQALRVVFLLIAAWYRDLLHVGAGREGALTKAPALPRVQAASVSLPLEAAAEAIALVAAAERQLDSNVNVPLCIEALLFKLAAQAERAAAGGRAPPDSW